MRFTLRRLLGLVPALLLLPPVSKLSAIEIVAHRGASSVAPENTLTAFILGYRQQADAVELDIHLSKDGKIVVMHDSDTARTAGKSLLIAAHTMAELRSLEVGKWGSWKGQGFTEQIPLLSEVLPLIPDGRRLFIEIKVGPEILPELGRVLEAGGKKSEQTVLIGFDYATMKAAKVKFPTLKVYWLLNYSRNSAGEYPKVQWLVANATSAKFDGVNLSSEWPIDKNFVDALKISSLRVYIWTVDDVAVAKREIAAGVDGITTNRAGWLREQLGL